MLSFVRIKYQVLQHAWKTWQFSPPLWAMTVFPPNFWTDAYVRVGIFSYVFVFVVFRQVFSTHIFWIFPPNFVTGGYVSTHYLICKNNIQVLQHAWKDLTVFGPLLGMTCFPLIFNTDFSWIFPTNFRTRDYGRLSSFLVRFRFDSFPANF